MRRLRVYIGIFAAIIGAVGSVLALGVNYKNGGLDGVCELISDATTRMGIQIEWLQCGRSALPKPEAAPVPPIPSADELFWLAIEDSTVPALFEEFLRKFPRSSHAAEAQEKLDALKKVAQQTKSVPFPQTIVPTDVQESERQKKDALTVVSQLEAQISGCRGQRRWGSTLLGIVVQSRVTAARKSQQASNAPWEVEPIPVEVILIGIRDLDLELYTKDLTVTAGEKTYTMTRPTWTIDFSALDMVLFTRISFEPMWRETHTTLNTSLTIKSGDCYALGLLIRRHGQR